MNKKTSFANDKNIKMQRMILMEYEEDKMPILPNKPEINPNPLTRPFAPSPQTYPGIPKMPDPDPVPEIEPIKNLNN